MTPEQIVGVLLEDDSLDSLENVPDHEHVHKPGAPGNREYNLRYNPP